jgi:hypothetical protein
MFIKSEKYSILQSACGIELKFTELRPVEEKLADIVSISRSNRISTAQIVQLSKPLSSGESVNIRSIASGINLTNPIDNSFTGDYTITNVTYPSNASSTATISYYQNLSDFFSINIAGDLYSIPNIDPAENYLIDFNIESIVPNSAEATLRPSRYIVSGREVFTPITILEIKSRFSTSAKVLVRMVLRDLKTNKILKNEYIEVVMTDADNKPCEIITQQPIDNEYYYLDISNNWTYTHDGYTLAQFIPNNRNNNISLRLNKKNNQLLPSRGNSNKIRVIVDPIKLSEKKVTIDQIRTAMVNQFNTIENYYAVANLGNKSYDIIVKDVFLQPADLNNIVVAVVPPTTGIPVKFNEVATAINYTSDSSDIPGISLLRWTNNNETVYIGELHFDKNVYLDDTIKVQYGQYGLFGSIKDFYSGLSYLEATPTPTPTQTPTQSVTPNATPTITPTISITPSITTSITPSVTITKTPTATPTISITPSITTSVTQTPSTTPTISITPSITASLTPTVTPTISITPSVTITKTPTVTPTISLTPSITATITPTTTPTISLTPSITTSMTPSMTSSVTPTATPEPITIQRIDDTDAVYSCSTSNSVNVTIPATVQSGDLILAIVMRRSSLTNTSGFSLVSEVQNPSTITTDQWTSIYSKAATSGDASSTITFQQSSNGRIGVSLVVLRSSNGIYNVESSATDSDTAINNLPTVTSGGSNRIAIAALSNIYSYTVTSGSACDIINYINAPAGYTPTTIESMCAYADSETTPNCQILRIGAAYKYINNAGSVNTGETFTSNIGTYNIGQIALIISPY